MEIVEYRAQKKFFDFLAEFLSDRGCKRIGIEKTRLSVFNFEELLKRLNVEFVGIDEIVVSHRRIKSSEEVDKIKKAIDIAQKAFLDTLDVLKAGMTEKEIAAYLEYRMKVLGGDVAFETIVASGKRSAMPHGAASSKVIEEGDVIVFDFGAVYEGYHSDITRMVVLKDASDEYMKIHELVLRAQDEVFKRAKPGMKGKEIDSLARDVIKDAGFEKNFGHGLGHGIGLEIHEKPRVSPLSDEEITPGMVFTVEPGIYFEGKFGVRVEEDVVMRDDGVEVLTSLDRTPFIVR